MVLGKFIKYILIHLPIGSRGICKNKMLTPSGNSNNVNAHDSPRMIPPLLTKECGYSKMTPPLLTKECVYSKLKYDLSNWEAILR